MGSKKSSKTVRRPRSENAGAAAKVRNPTLDVLRGLAIVLMIIDHIAWLYFDQNLEPPSIRIWTRLSMPLFCVLTGYFVGQKLRQRNLASKKAEGKQSLSSKDPKQESPLHTHWGRLGQLALAAALVNFVYFSLYGQFEILVSLLLTHLLMALTQSGFVLASLTFLLFPFEQAYWSNSAGVTLLDFPLSVVMTCSAMGWLMGRWKAWIGITASIGIALVLLMNTYWQSGFEIVTLPSAYVLFFLPFASILVALALRFNEVHIWGLEWIGRYPLSIYVAQYWILLLFAQ